MGGLHIDTLTIRRSYGDWAFFARDVDDLTVGHLSITGGTSLFEDGFHIEGCQRVAAGTLNVESGDYAVAIVQTTATTRPTTDVTFEAIVARSHHANIFKLEVDPGVTAGIGRVTVGNLVGDKSTGTTGNCIHIQDQSAGKRITDVSIANAQLNAGGSSGYAVRVSYATDVDLSGVSVTAPDGVAFDIDNVDRLLLRGCSTRGTRGASSAGFRLRSVTEFEVRDCRVTGATQHGFVIGAVGMAATDGAIRGSTARSCTGNGVHLDTASDVDVTGNRIKGCAWGIREENVCANNFITGNDVRGNTSAVSAGSGDHNGTYRDGNVGAGNRVHTFTNGDTTPSVLGRNRYHQTANTAATSITALDDGVDGQEVVIFIEDALTTFVHSATLRLEGGVIWTPTINDTITFARVGSQWTELARSAT